MIGIYLNEVESKLLIPLLIHKIDSFSALDVKEKFNQLEIGVYQEILGRIYAALKIGQSAVVEFLIVS